MTIPLLQKFNPLSGFNLVPQDLSSITLERTGFAEPDSVILNYDPTTQKVTLTGTVNGYYQDTKNITLASGYVSTAHTNTVGHYYWLYADGPAASDIKWMTDSFPGMDKLLIAIVIYYTNYKFAIRECHGMVMDWATHLEAHNAIGTYRTGGTITAGTYTLASTTATVKRPNVDELTIYDEDLKTVLPALTSKLYNKVYLTGTNTTPILNFTGETAEIVPMNTGITLPAYNQLSGGNWIQTAMPANAYQAIFVLAMPTTASTVSQAYRYLWVQGQTQSTTLSTIQAVTPNNLVLAELATLAPEYVFFAKIIIQYVGGGTANWNIVSVETLTGNKQGQSFSTNSGLSVVASDATLTGNGTAASPLSVLGNYSTTITSGDGAPVALFTPPTSTVAYSAQIYMADTTLYGNFRVDVINKNGTWEFNSSNVGDVFPPATSFMTVNPGTGVLSYVSNLSSFTAKLLVNYINF